MSETSIVSGLAGEAARRVARKAITELQRIKHTLSGEDSGLRTAWDEICVQVQEEHSIHWDAYDATVRGIVRRRLQGMAQHEREALWLQTEPGIYWQGRRSHEEEPATDLEDLVEYVTTEHVYVTAEQWSNPRIRAFIRRSRTWD